MLRFVELAIDGAAVSIHAPRCRGAMPLRATPDELRQVFQSTPPVAEGRCGRGSSWGGPFREFQSTPPVAEGRCGYRQRHPAPRLCFNPRPPLPRGDANTSQSGRESYRVSIHAPRCRGAMPLTDYVRREALRFQSTPPVAEGRCRALVPGARLVIGFNPRPPLPRGDARVTCAMMPPT